MSQRGGGRAGGGGGRDRGNQPPYGYGEGGGGRGGRGPSGYGEGGGGRGGRGPSGYGEGGGGRGGRGPSGYGDGGRGGGGGRGGRGGYGGPGGGGRGGRGGPATEVLTPATWKTAATPPLAEEAKKKLALEPPSSSKAVSLPLRPGFGNIGRPCVVRANHFPVNFVDKDFHHYDVSITPDGPSNRVCRIILDELVKCCKQSHLGDRSLAYDGKKSLYTAGPLPFLSKEFVVKLEDETKGPERREKQFKVAIKLAAKISLYQLQEFLQGRQLDVPQEAIQLLDVVMRASVSNNYIVIGRSLFSKSFGHGNLGSGFEYWRGYYQSLRPTQMGLSLNVDQSALPFYERILLTEFLLKYLNLRNFSKPLSDVERVKIRKILKGIMVETTYRGYKKRFKISAVTAEPADKVTFSLQSGEQTTVAKYFQQQYGIQLRFPFLPCIQSGQASKPTNVPMELCTLVEAQRYKKKLTPYQVTNMLKATCQRPNEREENIKKIFKESRYSENHLLQEFGIFVTDVPTSVKARVLPVPMIKYHDTGREPSVAPGMGQWNMLDKKMYRGAPVKTWTCLNFSSDIGDDSAGSFCRKLVNICRSKGMEVNPSPIIPIRTCRSGQADIKRALLDVHSKANELQLLIIILPDYSEAYGNIKRICETELGIVSQCCEAKNVSNPNDQYLQNLALKVNAKAGGINSALCDAVDRRIPLLSDTPTIIFGADVTHARPGEASTPSIASVVASMDWPEVIRYRALVSVQGVREEIIRDLYKVENDPKRGSVHGGMIRELLIAFRKSTGYKPGRILFYRDGVSEGQFAQVLLEEVDAIRKACQSLEEGYMPRVTFIVVQKRHHTRLFATDNNVDRSGNILPGTVVDSKICHPSQYDFYLCSHAGIKGTSRPTHYHVLFDENNFPADLLQLLTYSLCYTYARCTRSVSIVPPAYYAHLAAFRARNYIEVGESSDGSSSGGQTSSSSGVAVRPLPKIVGKVQDVMFYC